ALVLQVVDPLRPAHEVGDCALRPVAIEYFQAKSVRGQVALDRGERVYRRHGQQAARTLIAVDALPDEIVVAEIAHVDDQAVDDRGGIDESRRKRRLGTRGRRYPQQQHERQCSVMCRRMHRLSLRELLARELCRISTVKPDGAIGRRRSCDPGRSLSLVRSLYRLPFLPARKPGCDLVPARCWARWQGCSAVSAWRAHTPTTEAPRPMHHAVHAMHHAPLPAPTGAPPPAPLPPR